MRPNYDTNQTMLTYNKGKLKYRIFNDEEVSILNDDSSFSIVLLPRKAPNLYVNFEPINVEKSNVIFLSPGDALVAKSRIQECKMIVFEKGSMCTSENLIYLLFNATLREDKAPNATHSLRKSNKRIILEYFSKVEAAFVSEEFKEVIVLSHINNIIYECVYNTLFGDHKDIIDFSILLNSNYSKKHLVSQYADILRLPPKELLRAFKRRGFDKPSEIIKDRILLEVKKLLINTDLDVKEIGEKLGFEDSAYFSRFFKKNTGETALEFRKRYLQN